MKIGSRVVISTSLHFEELNGCRGVIVDEKIPESQMFMLCGISNFVVQLDEPIVLRGHEFTQITLPSIHLSPEREVCV